MTTNLVFYPTAPTTAVPEHHLGRRRFYNPQTTTAPVLTKYSSFSPISASANGRAFRGNSDIMATKGQLEDPYLLAGLRPDAMPRFVAINFDGRWAQGDEITYSPFYQAIYVLFAELCVKWGIPSAVIHIFNTETWNNKQNKEANNLFLGPFERFLEDNLENFTRQGMRVSIIGEKTMLPKSLQDTIKRVEEATKEQTKLELMLAVNYGGKWDIVKAAKSISKKVKEGVIKPEDISEDLIQQNLSTKNSSHLDPDLVILAGGTHRFNNFMLWHVPFSELYFTDTFGEYEFIDALRYYQQTSRRFGK